MALQPRSTRAYYVGLASRMLIFALAATSLNLILGFGGMVCFGHAAFFGLGAYTVAIAMSHGVASAWVAWPLAMVVAAAAGARDRRDLAAHARRVLHHDHAGLRADGVLPRRSR